MNPLSLPWLEIAIVASLVGSPAISFVRDPHRAFRGCLFFTGTSLVCALLAWLGFALGAPQGSASFGSIQPFLFGRIIFAIDELNAPLIAAVALIHFLVALATARTHMRRFSFASSLAFEAIRLAMFSCVEP